VGQLGGSDTPAVGWAIGLERLILLLQQLGQPSPPALDFYVISKGELAEQQALVLTQGLRNLGFSLELDLSGSAINKQFKRADRSGAVACLILGDAEAATSTVKLKFLATGEQKAINQGELLQNPQSLRQELQQTFS
jgi:histidyl-tRNA synthetase